MTHLRTCSRHAIPLEWFCDRNEDNLFEIRLSNNTGRGIASSVDILTVDLVQLDYANEDRRIAMLDVKGIGAYLRLFSPHLGEDQLIRLDIPDTDPEQHQIVGANYLDYCKLPSRGRKKDALLEAMGLDALDDAVHGNALVVKPMLKEEGALLQVMQEQ